MPQLDCQSAYDVLSVRTYAQQEGIMYSSHEQIEALARIVGELA